MTWADDGEIYTSSGDPLWGETVSGLDVEKFTGEPEDYVITKVNHMNDYLGWGGNGQKPTGMICVDGVLYLVSGYIQFSGTWNQKEDENGLSYYRFNIRKFQLEV